MADLMHDPMFFYTIAFVIFFVLAFKYGRKPLLGWVDGEILKIRDELEQAQKLRVEAESVLQTYKKKQAEALAEADAIIKHAEAEAVRMKAQAEVDLKASLARHEQQAAERIRIAESEATAAVRAAAVDSAIIAAKKALTSQIDGAAAGKLMDQAIADMPALATGKKSEAA